MSMNLYRYSVLLLLLSMFSLAFCLEHSDTNPDHQLPRSLIIDLPQNLDHGTDSLKEEEVRVRCRSWRVAVEANNLSPWKTIPDECVDYVKEYMLGPSYEIDLETVSNEAAEFAKTVALKGDGMDAWVFDVDETLLSNLPYYAQHGYGSEIFDHVEFDKWVLEGVAPAIKPSLDLYNEVLRLGFRLVLLTGRAEDKRTITINNLTMAGFRNWDKLILRVEEDHGKTAVTFKSDKRKEMTEEGFRLIGNSGDQWSDLIGSSVATRGCFALAGLAVCKTSEGRQLKGVYVCVRCHGTSPNGSSVRAIRGQLLAATSAPSWISP